MELHCRCLLRETEAELYDRRYFEEIKVKLHCRHLRLTEAELHCQRHLWRGRSGAAHHHPFLREAETKLHCSYHLGESRSRVASSLSSLER